MAAETVRRKLPSPTSQLWAVVHYELLRHLRRRRLTIMILLLVILVALPLGLPPLLGFPPPTEPYAFIGQVLGTGGGSLSVVHILVILAATFFGGDAILSEFEARTGYLIFPNPMKRSTLFFGKFLAALGLAVGIISGLYLVATVGVQIRAGTVPVELGYSWGLVLLYTSSALAVGFLVSSVLRNATAASVLTFFLFFLILRFVDFGLSAGQVKPIGSLTFASEVVGNILRGPYPQAYPVDTKISGGPNGNFSFWQYAAPVNWSIATMVIYAAGALALALVAFRRREMKG